MSAVDPDRACEHLNFAADVEVNRLTTEEGGPVTAFILDLTVSCADCEEKFRFHGVQAGLLADRPTCSVDEATLHAPIRPASSDPDFGLGIPGYAITYRSGS